MTERTNNALTLFGPVGHGLFGEASMSEEKKMSAEESLKIDQIALEIINSGLSTPFRQFDDMSLYQKMIHHAYQIRDAVIAGMDYVRQHEMPEASSSRGIDPENKKTGEEG